MPLQDFLLGVFSDEVERRRDASTARRAHDALLRIVDTAISDRTPDSIRSLLSSLAVVFILAVYSTLPKHQLRLFAESIWPVFPVEVDVTPVNTGKVEFRAMGKLCRSPTH